MRRARWCSQFRSSRGAPKDFDAPLHANYVSGLPPDPAQLGGKLGGELRRTIESTSKLERHVSQIGNVADLLAAPSGALNTNHHHPSEEGEVKVN